MRRGTGDRTAGGRISTLFLFCYFWILNHRTILSIVSGYSIVTCDCKEEVSIDNYLVYPSPVKAQGCRPGIRSQITKFSGRLGIALPGKLAYMHKPGTAYSCKEGCLATRVRRRAAMRMRACRTGGRRWVALRTRGLRPRVGRDLTVARVTGIQHGRRILTLSA